MISQKQILKTSITEIEPQCNNMNRMNDADRRNKLHLQIKNRQ